MLIDLQSAAAQAIERARPDDAGCFKLIVRKKEILCVPCKKELPDDWPVIGLRRKDLQEGLSARQWNVVGDRLRMAKEQEVL